MGSTKEKDNNFKTNDINPPTRTSDDEKEEKKEMLNDNTESLCGDVIYASQKLENRILRYIKDDNNDILRSIDGDFSIKIKWINNSDKDIYYYWINYEGDIRIPASIIKPNENRQINSFISHPFLISHSSNLNNFNDIIAVYIPTNVSYKTHNIIIDSNKNGTKIKTEPGTDVDDINKIDKKIWTINDYQKYILNGFIIYFENDLLDKYPGLMHVLNADLTNINNIVPRDALQILHSTPIWLNDSYLYYDYKINKNNSEYVLDIYKPKESMCFHPDNKWLTDHGNMSHKAECVEIYRVKDWIKERGYMPMVLLHEFGHAYHWYIDFQHRDILNAYNNAINSNKLYLKIPFILGGLKRAYALTNQMEYFSELTESYFGLNDFYPFNKDELEQYDKNGYDVIQKIWNLNNNQIFKYHQLALKRRKMEKQKDKEKEKQNKNNIKQRFKIDTSRIVSV